MNEQKELYCPTAIDFKCIKSECAWWLPGCRMCAVTVTGAVLADSNICKTVFTSGEGGAGKND